MTDEPSDATAGVAIAPPVEILVFDTLGNVATGFSDTLALDIAVNTGTPGATLSGPQLRVPAGGTATFDDLSIDLPGTGYQFQVATGGGIPTILSDSFDVLAGAADTLVFTVEPLNVELGQPIVPAIVVTASDSLGNTAAGFAGNVTLTITPGTGTAGATAAGVHDGYERNAYRWNLYRLAAGERPVLVRAGRRRSHPRSDPRASDYVADGSARFLVADLLRHGNRLDRILPRMER